MLKDSNLIFIISQPRSGSTLLQSLISNNPYVSTANEPWLLLPFLGFYVKGLNKAKYNYDWMNWSVNEFIKNNVGEHEYKTRLKDFLLSLYASLDGSETRYVLDKTPRYYEIVFVMKEIFPEARFIILKRNPFAVLNSIIKTWNISSLEKLLEYKYDLLSAPLQLQKFLDASASMDNVIHITYEALVREPESTMRNIYAWLDLPFHSDVLNYSNNEKIKGKLGDQISIKQNVKPIDSSALSWKVQSKNSFWNNFFKGYSSYLGADFLQRYGSYESLGEKKTDEFNYFLFACSRRDKNGSTEMKEFKAILKSLYYQFKFGKINKPLSVK